VPTYEYECKACKRTFEAQHRINDPAPTTCEECGGELRRIFYPPGLVFKGGGFYSTESRFGRSTDKRESFKKDEAKPDSASKDSSSKDSAAPSSSKPSSTSAGTEKSA
jgi:putative FmdB family regulatory protein